MKKNTLLALFILGIAACGGAEDSTLDGDATQASFSMQAVSPTAAATNLLSTRGLENVDGSLSPDGSSVTITTAFINIAKIELELPDGMGCEDAGFVEQNGVRCKEEVETEHSENELEAEIEISGPVLFDLMAGTSDPSISSFSLPSGLYSEIEIEIDAPEAGSSFSVGGTFVDADSVEHAFQMDFDFSEELELENEAGISMAEGDVNAIVMQLNVNDWFAGVDLATCVADGALVLDADSLVIDEDSEATGDCSDVKELIKENIKNSFELDEENEEDDSENDDSSVDEEDAV